MDGATDDVAQEQREHSDESPMAQILAQLVLRLVEEIGERNGDERRKGRDDGVDRLRWIRNIELILIRDCHRFPLAARTASDDPICWRAERSTVTQL